jgi:probable HAF family extracellular repeat protein
MKTPRFNISIVMAAAIGTLVLIVSNAQAEWPKKFGRFRSSERDETDLTSTDLRQNRSAKIRAPARPISVPPEYPRYRLINLGTLGGPNSSHEAAVVSLNNRGDAFAVASTDTLDPYPFTLQDEFIWHGILSNTNGIVTDLGALPGINQSIPLWITENGLIAGLSGNGLIDDLTGFPQMRPVLWDHAGNIHDLGTFGGNTGLSNSMNSRGQVVGSAANSIAENPDIASFMNYGIPAAQQVRAFLWHAGAMRDLGTLGGNDAFAAVINDGGRVVGLSCTDTVINDTTGLPTVHPFVWNNGTMRDLGSLGGTLSVPGSLSFGPGGQLLNDSGDVAGTSTLSGDEDWHAFVWLNASGRMIDLGTLGGNLSEALAINNRGQVVGRARTTNMPNSHHPFLWERGQMTDLGVAAPCQRGTAESINSADQIVGGFGSCTADPDDRYYFRAFYWQKGMPIVELNTLITPPSEINVDDASCINDRGEIVGIGVLPDGSTRAVLLVPIPPGR